MPANSKDGESEIATADSEHLDPTTGGASEKARETELEDELDEPAETPFDHPLFLPAICLGLWVWFGYDGFLNQDPDMLEHVGFNRGGFAVLTALTGWFGYKGIREIQARNAERSPDQDDSADSSH